METEKRIVIERYRLSSGNVRAKDEIKQKCFEKRGIIKYANSFKARTISFLLFSNEGSEPAHIHVESDDCYAKFWLNPVRLSRSVGYNARDLNDIRKLAIEKCKVF